MSKLTLILLFVTFALFQNRACDKQGEIEETFNVNSRVELLFFFTKDSSKESRDYFYENVLNKPVSGGYWPRDGVKATFGIDRNGYEGFGLKFEGDATMKQREDVRHIIKSSTVVYRVYENVVPNEIKDL